MQNKESHLNFLVKCKQSALEAAIKITSNTGITIDTKKMPPISQEDIDKMIDVFSGQHGIMTSNSIHYHVPPYIEVAQIIYEWMVKDDKEIQELLAQP